MEQEECDALLAENSRLRQALSDQSREVSGLKADIMRMVRYSAMPFVGLVSASYNETFATFDVNVQGRCRFGEEHLFRILDTPSSRNALVEIMGEKCLKMLLDSVQEQMDGESFESYKKRRGGG